MQPKSAGPTAHFGPLAVSESAPLLVKAPTCAQRECREFADTGAHLNSLGWPCAQAGYETPTPIQQQAYPAQALAGKDVLGCAQTGTGKTAAFFGRCSSASIQLRAGNQSCAPWCSPPRGTGSSDRRKLRDVRRRPRLRSMPYLGGVSGEAADERAGPGR